MTLPKVKPVFTYISELRQQLFHDANALSHTPKINKIPELTRGIIMAAKAFMKIECLDNVLIATLTIKITHPIFCKIPSGKLTELSSFLTLLR